MTIGAERHRSWACQPCWCRAGRDVSSSVYDYSAKFRKQRLFYRGRIYQFCVKDNLSGVLRRSSPHISEITSNTCLIHTKNILLKNSTLKSTSSLTGHHFPNNSCARLAQLNTNNPHKAVSECHLICWQADGSKQADYHPFLAETSAVNVECHCFVQTHKLPSPLLNPVEAVFFTPHQKQNGSSFPLFKTNLLMCKCTYANRAGLLFNVRSSFTRRNQPGRTGR